MAGLNIDRDHERTRNRERMRAVLKDPAKKETCVMCGESRLPNWRTPAGSPVCGNCYHRYFAPAGDCAVCKSKKPLARRRPPTCYDCYFEAYNAERRAKTKRRRTLGDT